MKCPEEIGIPLSLQIWHDNSGGKEAGWYLGKVVFVDLQQKRWFVVADNNILYGSRKYSSPRMASYSLLKQATQCVDLRES